MRVRVPSHARRATPARGPWPEPVVLVYPDAGPGPVKAVGKSPAFTLSKFATVTLSPVVWSAPAATGRLIAVMLPVAANVSASEPAPPSIEFLVGPPWG